MPSSIEVVAPPGKLYNVGFDLHLCSEGIQGSAVTVLIEAGNGLCAAAYSRLRSALAPHVRVISYDRAGLGWSGDSGDVPDAAHVCCHLRRLLHAACVPLPLVIVAHSIGGLFARVFAGRFPTEVAGIVFLDSIHVQTDEYFNGNERIDWICGIYRAARACVKAGRLPESDFEFIQTFADVPAVQAQLRHSAMQVRRYDVALATTLASRASQEQAASFGSLGNLPLVAVTAPVVSDDRKHGNIDWSRFRAVKASLDEQLASLSTRGRHVVIAGAEHGTLIYEAKFVEQLTEEILALTKQDSSGQSQQTR